MQLRLFTESGLTISANWLSDRVKFCSSPLCSAMRAKFSSHTRWRVISSLRSRYVFPCMDFHACHCASSVWPRARAKTETNIIRNFIVCASKIIIHSSVFSLSIYTLSASNPAPFAAVTIRKHGQSCGATSGRVSVVHFRFADEQNSE